MAVVRERTEELVQAYRRHGTDTGSPEVQIALLTVRIGYLTGHFIIPAVGCSRWWGSAGDCSTTSSNAISSVTRA